jgi:hypothetical protein
MIVNQLKEVQLVTESRAVKLDSATQTLQRYDRTVYIEEPTTIKLLGSGEAYVEAVNFFALLPEAERIEIEPNLVKVTLKNKAEYKLPKLDVKWAQSELPKHFNISNSINIKLAAGRLTSATLKNLANPMLQCIYMDSDSGVSCNSMVACIDGTTLPDSPILLPPDIVLLMEGKESQLEVVGSNFVVKIEEAFIVCAIPQYDYTRTAEVLRKSLPKNITKYPIGPLFEEVKRLSAFGDFLSFDGERAIVKDNFEPFSFKSAIPKFKYGVQYLLTIVPQVTHIAQSEFALLLYGDNFLFMISPEEEGN